MANGNMISRAESGLKPLNITVNNTKHVAIAFLEAKKPFVVENRPAKAKNSEAKLISGVSSRPSRGLPQLKNGSNAIFRFEKKWPNSYSSEKSRCRPIDQLLKMFIASIVTPARAMMQVAIKGMRGSVLIVKRRWGFRRANKIIKMSKYIMCGVKILPSRNNAKIKQYRGRGFFTP